MILRRILLLTVLLLSGLTAMAQEPPADDDFGAWGDIQINKSFSSGIFTALRAEYRCCNSWSEMDFWFLRPTVGYKFTDWLSAGLCYDYRQYNEAVRHCGLAFVTGTLKSGQLTASLREMFVRSYSFEDAGIMKSNVLRSRLNVQYSEPVTGMRPYMCIEMFTWRNWQNSRHYVGAIIPLAVNCNLDLSYLFLTKSSGAAQHILCAGLNISL